MLPVDRPHAIAARRMPLLSCFAGNRGLLSAGAFSISLPSGVRADYARRCVDVPSATILILAAETSAFSNV
jgi:hypothetical protein